MKMIVGLGNIGPQYDHTRHNTGFMAIDHFCHEHELTFKRSKMEAMVATGVVLDQKVIVVKPTTYMNESGRAVKPLMDYYDVDITDLVIIHDDMDLPVGKIRLKTHGSAGGHNGLKSLISHLGTQQFNRIKVGIDHPQKVRVVDYVLGKFKTEQIKSFNDSLIQAVSAIDDWLEGETFDQLMNQFN
ncbi:aminoacyl-tRNA hydrolase [Paucilactobacillus wasatchensis]|uniref:Peptidyl-tRNA hydrolase n=1 Tax=Paucilactobacillus wasatchensis TaxID=1335616 RepID=A0A0D0YY98_9LACO|nr:aminoacyl-tRNA hydrolase [Paucilactobacillus wasatchensis]KIS04184.1 Peptidyl-tRNA hydrolase [Paucilactobacillus wasatchensis]